MPLRWRVRHNAQVKEYGKAPAERLSKSNENAISEKSFWVMTKHSETDVCIILGKPQWRWQRIEYSPQSLALCVCVLPCWPALTAQLLNGFFVLLLHCAPLPSWDKPLLGDGKAFRKQMSSQLLASRSGGGSTSSTHLNLSLSVSVRSLAGRP